MKLYVTYTSPYARLARILVIEKGLGGRVEIVEAKTRALDSPYYAINPSGRVPYLVDAGGAGMEDSRLICVFRWSGRQAALASLGRPGLAPSPGGGVGT
jgi:glutathione S-transferase